MVFHPVDIAKVNVFLFYLRQCLQLQVPKKHQLLLRSFIVDIATSLNVKGSRQENLRNEFYQQSLLQDVNQLYRNPILMFDMMDIHIN